MYNSEKQTGRKKKSKEKITIVDEKLLSERVYFGIKTHIYVAYLRYFKLGGYEGTEIKTITDLAQHIYRNGTLLKHEKGEHTPLELSSIITELYKIEAVIKQEDTENVDAYGYNVKINNE